MHDNATIDRFFAVLAEHLGDHYQRVDDADFRWLTPFEDADHARIAAVAGYGARRLREVMPELTIPHDRPLWPVVLLADVEDQLAYHELFADSEDAHDEPEIIDGGCWRSWPVGHLAIPVASLHGLDAVFVHELVHGTLDPSGIPAWIQEGLAQEAEARMGQKPPPTSDPDALRAALDWWRTHPLDPFWDGAAFRESSSSPHAYLLSWLIVLRWLGDQDTIAGLQAEPREAWDDPDALLLRRVGCDRAGIAASILTPTRRMGLIERLLHGLFVGGS